MKHVRNSRTFSFQTHVSNGVGEGLIDIPHPRILGVKSPADIVKEFCETWGHKAKGVVLPCTAPDGLLFDIEGIPLQRTTMCDNMIQLGAAKKPSPGFNFSQAVADFAAVDPDLEIYIMLSPGLQFVSTDPLHVQDIRGVGSNQVCVCNEKSQQLLGAILGTAVDLALDALGDTPDRLKGCVLNLVDILPMGAKGNHIHLTCFCESCVKGFKEKSPELVRHFKVSPNPWNLALTDNGTGIGYIDDIDPDTTPQDIVALSRMKGYDSVFGQAEDNHLQSLAVKLLEYIKVRHQLTVEAMNKIYEEAFKGIDSPPGRIILTEGCSYNWTAGLVLKELDHPQRDGDVYPPFDEVWFNNLSSETSFRIVKVRSYMWRRSRYFVDAFIEFVAQVADPVMRATTGMARISTEDIKNLMRTRLQQCLGTADSNRTSIAALPNLASDSSVSTRIGIVSPCCFTKEVGESMISLVKVAPGIGGAKMPTEGNKHQIENLLRQMIGSNPEDSK